MAANEGLECPFCHFADADFNILGLHIESLHDVEVPVSHTPGSKTSKKSSSDSLPTEAGFLKCTRADCGAFVALSEVDEHLELHSMIDEDDANDVLEARPELPPRPIAPRDTTRYAKEDTARSRDSTQDENHTKLGKQASSARSEGDGLLRWLGVSPAKYKPAANGTGSSVSRPASSVSSSSRSTTLRNGRSEFSGRKQDRSDLGPYARETAMPQSIRNILLSARIFEIEARAADGSMIEMDVAENETRHLVPLLADLAALDSMVAKVYVCDEHVHHVSKIPNEGSFCGYRNIQMLSSYLNHVHPSRQHITRIPTIFEIQEVIERAWDNGVCAHCRGATGGIRGTRKWIGTEEVVAFCTQVGVRVQPMTFPTAREGPPAHEALLDHVEAYFISSPSTVLHSNVARTELPPIYFQQPGHSLTIVGLERLKDGSRRLLVFDPSFGPTREIRRLLRGGRLGAATDLARLLRPYRRGVHSLARHDEFEIVTPVSKDLARIG